MGLPDKHDNLGGPQGQSRLFTHYAKVDDAGNVVAVVEVADGSPPPEQSELAGQTDPTLKTSPFFYIDITYQYPHDVHGLKIPKAVVKGRDPIKAKLALIDAIAKREAARE